MIIALKLINGDEIIGRLHVEDNVDPSRPEQFELYDPMWIIPDEKGSIRLRDALVLYSNPSLIFFPEHVIVCYIPSKSLHRYYQAAIQYSIEFTRGSIDSQIDESCTELEQWLEATREHMNAKKLKLH